MPRLSAVGEEAELVASSITSNASARGILLLASCLFKTVKIAASVSFYCLDKEILQRELFHAEASLRFGRRAEHICGGEPAHIIAPDDVLPLHSRRIVSSICLGLR